jgi:hypothetical protein
VTEFVKDRVDAVVLRMVDAYAPDPVAPVRPGDSLLDDLAFTSLRLVELAFALEDLEDLFDMDPAAMGEAPPVGTVTDLSAFVFGKVSGGEARLPAQADVDAVIAEL